MLAVIIPSTIITRIVRVIAIYGSFPQSNKEKRSKAPLLG
jgi:hypothetical protein